MGSLQLLQTSKTVGPFAVENSGSGLAVFVPAALVTVELEPASEEQKQEWELVEVKHALSAAPASVTLVPPMAL